MSILADFVLRHPGSGENAASDALQLVLERSPAAMAGLLGLLAGLGIADLHPATIRREVTGGEGERPDFVLADRAGRERVVIEAKFWAGLTQNQPNGYLARLGTDTQGALVFVCPPTRVTMLWDEVTRQIQDPVTWIPDLPVGVGGWTSHGQLLAVVSWQQVLAAMQESVARVGDLPTAADLDQIAGLVARFGRDDFLPVFPEVMAPQVARAVLSYAAILDDLVRTALVDGVAESTTSRSSMNRYYGSDLIINGRQFWLGVWWERWADLAETPFWIHSYDASADGDGIAALRVLAERTATRVHRVQEGGAVPLFPPMGVPRAEVLRGLMNNLHLIHESLPGTRRQ